MKALTSIQSHHDFDTQKKASTMGFQVFGNTEIVRNKAKVALTFGNFDGVHLGHVNLVQQLKAYGLPTVALTFDPHPTIFFHSIDPDLKSPKSLLDTLEVRVRRLLELGVDAVVVQQFDASFAVMDPDSFCDEFLKKNFQLGHVLFGYNTCYGKNGTGNFHSFARWASSTNVGYSQIDPFTIGSKVVSSSHIRRLIEEGNAEHAAIFLGRKYEICGTIVHGDETGRKLGFPTANLDVSQNILLPQNGVYTCEVILTQDKKRLPAVMNCGFRPTLKSGLKLQIEAHILNFDQQIYGFQSCFAIHKKLRNEKKFNNLSDLSNQLKRDVAVAVQYFDIS